MFSIYGNHTAAAFLHQFSQSVPNHRVNTFHIKMSVDGFKSHLMHSEYVIWPRIHAAYRLRKLSCSLFRSFTHSALRQIFLDLEHSLIRPFIKRFPTLSWHHTFTCYTHAHRTHTHILLLATWIPSASDIFKAFECYDFSQFTNIAIFPKAFSNYGKTNRKELLIQSTTAPT